MIKVLLQNGVFHHLVRGGTPGDVFSTPPERFALGGVPFDAQHVESMEDEGNRESVNDFVRHARDNASVATAPRETYG